MHECQKRPRNRHFKEQKRPIHIGIPVTAGGGVGIAGGMRHSCLYCQLCRTYIHVYVYVYACIRRMGHSCLYCQLCRKRPRNSQKRPRNRPIKVGIVGGMGHSRLYCHLCRTYIHVCIYMYTCMYMHVCGVWVIVASTVTSVKRDL